MNRALGARARAGALAIAVIVFVAPIDTGGMTTMPEPFSARAAAAASVVLARSGAPETVYRDGMPFTETTFSLLDVFAGAAPTAAIRLAVPGGPLPGGRRLKVAGAPSFAEGVDYLLFLGPPSAGGKPRLLNYEDVYPTFVDETTGDRYIRHAPPLSIRGRGNARGVPAGGARVRLQDFLDEIRSHR